MKVVAYCRYSSENQRDGYSIEAQLSAIRSFCDANHYDLIQAYVDEARSGTNDDREKFQAMIEESKQHLFDAVVVHKLDRFARNRYDAVVYKKVLRDNGVKVLSVVEKLDDSPEAIIMEGLYEAMAEYYSANLAREVMKGKNQAARACKFPGGNPAFGYCADENQNFKINDQEADAVRFIYSEFLAGSTLSAISQELYNRGFRNHSGSTIIPSMLYKLIQRPIYCGTYVYGSIVVPDGVPAIVSREVWDAANAKIAENKNLKNKGLAPAKPKNKKESYFLTGFVRCGVCGSCFTGYSHLVRDRKRADGTRKETQHYYYRCSHRSSNQRDFVASGKWSHRCSNKRLINKDGLEALVMSCINSFLSDAETIKKLSVALETNQKEKIQKDEKTKKAAMAAAEKLKIKINKLLDLYLSGDIEKATYLEKTEELKKQLALYDSDLKTSNVAIMGADDFQKSLLSLLPLISSDADSKRKLAAILIDVITIYEDRIVLSFKLPICSGSSVVSCSIDAFVRECSSASTHVFLRTTLSLSSVLPGAHNAFVFSLA